MNKQRKVVITTTYNEMGIIIDTKAEEVAQPNLQPTCNRLATDCISRQAAIDALDKVAEMFPYRIPGKAKTYRQYNEAWSDAIDAAENALEALPSAQPVEDARAMCGECDAWNQYKNPQTGWIPTSVKPPEPFKLVLIQDYCGCYELNTYIPPRINPKQYPNGYWGEVGNVDFDYFDVEAWCPLPAPYCPEGEEHERFD